MRLFLLTILGVFTISFSAHADQTDGRLDGLFQELRSGEAINAEENVGRILEIWADAQSDTVDLLYVRALESADRGSFDIASVLLDHVIGLAPNFAEAYALRGSIRLAEENQAGAISDFNRAIELEPRQFVVRVILAGILSGNNEPRAAYEMYQKALEWNPHDEYARDRARILRRNLDGQEI